jgi:hypothetical protein
MSAPQPDKDAAWAKDALSREINSLLFASGDMVPARADTTAYAVEVLQEHMRRLLCAALEGISAQGAGTVDEGHVLKALASSDDFQLAHTTVQLERARDIRSSLTLDIGCDSEKQVVSIGRPVNTMLPPRNAFEERHRYEDKIMDGSVVRTDPSRGAAAGSIRPAGGAVAGAGQHMQQHHVRPPIAVAPRPQATTHTPNTHAPSAAIVIT